MMTERGREPSTRCPRPHRDDPAVLGDPPDHQRRETRKHHAHKLVRTQHPHAITDSQPVTTECEAEPLVSQSRPAGSARGDGDGTRFDVPEPNTASTVYPRAPATRRTAPAATAFTCGAGRSSAHHPRAPRPAGPPAKARQLWREARRLRSSPVRGNEVERTINAFKGFRAGATRFDKRTYVFRHDHCCSDPAVARLMNPGAGARSRLSSGRRGCGDGNRSTVTVSCVSAPGAAPPGRGHAQRGFLNGDRFQIAMRSRAGRGALAVATGADGDALQLARIA